MQSQLEQLEKDFGIEWQEYTLSQLFEIHNTLSFNKDKLTAGSVYDYVTRTSQNQGILQETGFVNQENINPAGTWSLGLLQMDFFYRSKPWYAGQFVRKIVPKIELSKNAVLYFTVLFNKQKQNLLSGLVRDVDEAFLNAKVSLPTKNSLIAFDFIEKFVATLHAERVATLHAERVATLHAYLKTTGLNDVALTAAEQAALDGLDAIDFGTFNLKNLYGNSSRGRRLKSADRIDGDLPFVTAGETDTGISAWIGNAVHKYSKNTVTIDMFGSAKYRNYDYGADDHVAIVHTEKLPKFAVLFLTAAIHKSSHAGQFDYSRNFYASDADELNISLPIKSDNTPNYEYMSLFISAIQKVVIKNVVDYLDMRIESTNTALSH